MLPGTFILEPIGMGCGMTDVEYDRKRDELDQLLNDPEMPICPDRIWALAEHLAAVRPELTRSAVAE